MRYPRIESLRGVIDPDSQTPYSEPGGLGSRGWRMMIFGGMGPKFSVVKGSREQEQARLCFET